LVLAAGVALAQRGGGARGGGGFRGGGGMRGGYRGGGFNGTFRGYGGYGGYRGYGAYRGYRGYWGYRGYRGYYGAYYAPYWGWGWPFWGWGFDFSLLYAPGYDSYNTYSYPYASYAYQSSPNVTVIYPAAQSSTNMSTSVYRQYDQSGQEVRRHTGTSNSGSPIYLIAFNDQVIRPTVAYWADGRTLHYVTLDHQEMQVRLDTVDRMLSLELNRQRHVAFQLPAHEEN
jgi:hypothetical protein